MKKKIFCLLLAVSMSLNLCILASAHDIVAEQSEAALEETIQAEIESEKERIFSSVYQQLEAQDALDSMEIYESILTPKIEANVRAKYGLLSARDVDTYVYSFPNGGTIGYNDVLNTTVLDTFMTPSQLETYVLEKSLDSIFVGEFEAYLSNLFAAMGISFGPWGITYQFLSTLGAVVTASAINDIRNNGGWGEQIAVSASGGAETSCVLVTWSSHPDAIIPGTATNIKPKAF